MAKSNSLMRDFTDKVQIEAKKNTISAKKIELSVQLDKELEALRLLSNDSKDSLQKGEHQLKARALKVEIDGLENKIKKLELNKQDINAELNSALLKPSQIVQELLTNYSETEKDFLIEFGDLLGLIGSNQSFGESYKRFHDYLTMDSVKYILTRDVDQGKTIQYYVNQIEEIIKSLNKLEQSKEKLDDQETEKSRYESRKLKAQTHAAILTNKMDELGKKLANFDGNDKLSINKSLTTIAKNDYKLAKMQNKEGDDSNVELYGEKFTGFGNEEIAFAYQTAHNLGLGSDKIMSNITISIKANAEQFKHYLMFRFKDKNIEDTEMALIIKTIDSGSFSIENKLEKQLMQIYLSDYSNRIGVTPFDVIVGLNDKTINVDHYSKAMFLADTDIKNTHNIIEEAIKSMSSEQQALIAQLSSEQRAWLDLHITGLFLYRQESIVSTSSGTKLYEESGNTLSVGIAQTLLDRTFGKNGSQSVHVDLSIIPSIPLTAKSIGIPKFFAGPNGSYRIDMGNTQLFATGFVGSSIQGNVGGGGLVGVTRNISGKKFGSKVHYITLGAGGGATSFDGAYISGFMGMGVDHIKSIVNNAEILGTLLNPIIGGLTSEILSDDKQFISYLKTNKEINVKHNTKIVGELQELLRFLAEYAGGVDNLQSNPQETFAEVLAQAYEHNARLDFTGLKVDGIIVDPVKFLTSTTLWSKVSVLAGLLKINNYKTLISHSGEYRQSASEIINTVNQSPEKRAETIATRLTQYISSAVGFTDYHISFDDKGNVIVPKNASVYVNNNNQDDISIGSDEQIDVIIIKDRILITTKKIEAEQILQNSTTIITKQPKIDIFIDEKDIIEQKNVAIVDCRRIERTFDEMQGSINGLLDGVKDRTVIDRTHLKHISDPKQDYLLDLKILSSTTPYSREEMKNLISSETNYHSLYDVGRLNAWLLVNYDHNNKDNNAYKIYQKLLRYETVIGGSFLELNNSRSLLRVTQREKHLNTRLKKEPAKDHIIKYRGLLTKAMKDAPYQGFAQVDNTISGFTWGYNSDDHYDKTLLKDNIFITTSGSVEKGKSFIDTFVNVKIDPKDKEMIDYVKTGLNSEFASQYLSGYKQTLNNQKITIGEKTGTLSELGYHYDMSLLDSANFYDTKSITLDILDEENCKVGATTIDKSKSGFYVVGNWQCGANETFVFVPDWSVIPPAPPSVPNTPVIENQSAPVSVTLKQEIVKVDNVTRGMVIGGGYGIAKGTLDTDPKTGDKRTTDPKTGEPIKTGPETGSETNTPINNNPDSPISTPPGGNNNPDSPISTPPGGNNNPDSQHGPTPEQSIGNTNNIVPVVIINESH